VRPPATVFRDSGGYSGVYYQTCCVTITGARKLSVVTQFLL